MDKRYTQTQTQCVHVRVNTEIHTKSTNPHKLSKNTTGKRPIACNGFLRNQQSNSYTSPRPYVTVAIWEAFTGRLLNSIGLSIVTPTNKPEQHHPDRRLLIELQLTEHGQICTYNGRLINAVHLRTEAGISHPFNLGHRNVIEWL